MLISLDLMEGEWHAVVEAEDATGRGGPFDNPADALIDAMVKAGRELTAARMFPERFSPGRVFEIADQMYEARRARG